MKNEQLEEIYRRRSGEIKAGGLHALLSGIYDKRDRKDHGDCGNNHKGKAFQGEKNAQGLF